MQEIILATAWDKISKMEPLASAEVVAIRDWEKKAKQKISHLHLESQAGFLSEAKYVELQTLTAQLGRLRSYRNALGIL